MSVRLPTLLPALVLLLSCRVAEVQEPCLDDPDLCPTCEADAECVLMGNPCYETVDCAHRDAELAYAMLGCSEALEYAWPDDSACACVERTCQYVE